MSNQAAYLLSFDVVSIVIAVRKNVGSDKNTALGLRTESFVAAAFDHIEKIIVLLSSVSVADAVKTAEVGAGFGRSDDVVDGNAQVSCRQINVNEHCTEFLILAQGIVKSCFKAWSNLV